MVAMNCDQIPPLDEWERRLRSASDDELWKLWQRAQACLARDIPSQKWAEHVSIAQRLMRERGMKF
jgi:hypothetical protein